MNLNYSSSATFPAVSHFDKLYEPPDTTKPQSTLTIGTPQFTSGGVTFVGGGTLFHLTATDSNDDVQNLWYRSHLYGSAAPSFTPVFGASTSFLVGGADGLYLVDTYATDNSGNDEPAHETVVYLDGTPPQVAIAQPTATAYVHSATLTLSYSVADAASGVATVTAMLDGSATLASGQPINLLTQLALGTHTFAVSSSDQVGNDVSRSVVFTIIVTPLSIQADVQQFVASGDITNSRGGNSLLSILQAAASAESNGACKAAISDYQSFIQKVQAQTGKGVSPAAAQILIGDASYLIAHCP
jgi:hypothetical protein